MFRLGRFVAPWAPFLNEYPVSWSGRQRMLTLQLEGYDMKLGSLVRDELLKELSRALWRTTSSLFEREPRRLAWSAASIDPLKGYALEL